MNEETNGSEVTKLRAEVARLQGELTAAQLNYKLSERAREQLARERGEPTAFDHRREVLATTAAQLAKTLEATADEAITHVEARATIRHELLGVANALAELRRQERMKP